MAMLLRESEVGKLATMDMAIEAVEQAFKLQGDEKADVAPRRRCRLEGGMLHVMSAALPTLGYAGLKTYTQVIESDAGKRTRVLVGPFTSRHEAELAAAKIKRAGLPANVIAL